MTRLSVNLNKVALLRNQRDTGAPSVIRAAELCIDAGAEGITVHPRPGERHIRHTDVTELRDYLKAFPAVEYNIEGNPFPEFMQLVRQVRPTQVTLVPDTPEAATSDHGWNIGRDVDRLAPIVAELTAIGSRVSLFMDVETRDWERVRKVGANRVELYTKPYADTYGTPKAKAVLQQFAEAARAAQAAGLGVNAGHDLNLDNLADF